LWERRADDADTLRMRIGLFDGPATVQLVPAAKEATVPAVPTSFCVPVSMRLTTTGVLGLAGPVDASRALARWLVAQAAVLHSPRDLSIVVLAADPAVGPHWNWVRWLPHCAPRGGEDCVALVGADPDSAAKRVTELVAEVSARLAKVPQGQDGGGGFGGGAGASAEPVASSDLGARALAPVRDVSRDDSDSAIPDSARLLDLIHMPDPSPELVLMAWQKRGRTTKIPIGVSADGPFILDLSADGPHGLVAGTTGAGKSELLQTIIAVLCVANRPDAMTFVLIDYKGGSAFKDCARLPHTVGMVSDLDGHLT